MTLQPGAEIGAYRVTAFIGRGGMGEVYRARDSRLDRDVALKVLPDTLAADTDRVARLEREAKLLASLNHPNIAAIYELLESDGRRVLVMELVEGPTLADRVRTGPIAIDEAVAIFVQIADGLEAAHERGVVHRDLKPDNIKTPPGGRVKILDFGIAKQVGGERVASGATGDVGTSDLTVFGLTGDAVVLGTPAYMSPEQARGYSVDRRTDIWAFGCCLYEAVTGRPAFAAATTADTIARIVHAEPDWTGVPDVVPPVIRVLLGRCLRKDARRRLRDIGDARIELEDLAGASEAGAATPRAVRPGADFKAILLSRIHELDGVTQRLGMAAVTRLVTRHDAVFRECLARHDGTEQERSGDGFFATFELPSNAVRCALACQQALAALDTPAPVRVAIGIHAAEIGDPADLAGAARLSGLPVDTAARLAGLARPGQILLTGAASESARREVATAPDGTPVLWVDHGPYLFKDLETPLQIVEAGVVGLSALSRPRDTETVRRAPKPRPSVPPIYQSSKP